MTSVLGDPRRRAPQQSQKYRNVSSRLDTGPNMRKTLAQFEGTSGPNARIKQRDEYFSTIKPLTLAKLLEPCLEEEESIYKVDADDVQSVASGISSVVLQSDAGSRASVAGCSGNLLILDLRPFEEYERCHIYGAMHYDRTNLSKATNNFPKEIYYYRGPMDSDKMVLLYDGDGKTLHDVANDFVQKGVENTYVLLGGFVGVCSRCPHVLNSAPPPIAAVPSAVSKSSRPVGSPRSVAPSRCDTAASSRTQDTNLSYANSPAAPGSRPWK